MPQNTRTPQSKRYSQRLGLEELPPMAINQKDGKTTYITKDEYKKQYLDPWLSKLNKKDPYAYDSTQLDHVKYAKTVGYLSSAEYTVIANKYINLVKELRARPLIQNVNGKDYGVEIAGPDGVYKNATGADLTIRNKAGEASYVKFAGYPANAKEFEALSAYNVGVREGRTKEIAKAFKPSTGIAKATNDWISPVTFKEFAKDVAVPVLGTGKAAIHGISRIGNEIDRALDLPTDPYYDPPQQLGSNFGDRVTAFSEGVGSGVGAAGAEVLNVAQNAPGIANFRQFAYGGPDYKNAVNESSGSTFIDNAANQYPGNKDYGQGLITGNVGAKAAFSAATGIAGMNVTGSLGARALAGIGKEGLGRTLGMVAHVSAPVLAQIAQATIAPDQQKITDVVGWVTNAPEQAMHTMQNKNLTNRMAEDDPTQQYTKSVHQLASIAMFGGGAAGFLGDVKNIAGTGMRAFTKLSKNEGFIKSAAGSLQIAGRSMVARQVGMEAAFAATGPLHTAGQALVARISNTPESAPTYDDWSQSILGALFMARPSKMMGQAFHSSPLQKLDVSTMAYSRAYESVNGKLDRPAELVSLEASRVNNFNPDKSDVKKVVHELEKINNELISNVVKRSTDVTELPKPFNDSVTMVKTVLQAHRTGDWTGVESFESSFNELFPAIRRVKYKIRDSVANPLDQIELTGRYTQDRAENKAMVRARALELKPAFERMLLGKGEKKEQPELQKGKNYYGIPLGDGEYMLLTRDFKNPRIVRGDEPDFDLKGSLSDVQLIDVHGGKFTSDVDKTAVDLISEIAKHEQGIDDLISNSFDIDGVPHVFQGIAPNGDLILSYNGEKGKSVVTVPIREIESTTRQLTRNERKALQFLQKYSTGEKLDSDGLKTKDRNIDGIDPDYPKEIPINEHEAFLGRLIYNNGKNTIYQTRDGSFLLANEAKPEDTVYPPVPKKNTETDKYNLSFKDQLLQHPEASGGLFSVKLTDAIGNESLYVIRLSGDHVDALRDLYQYRTFTDDTKDAIFNILGTAINAEGTWQSKTNPVKPEIGDIVTMRDNDNKKFIIVAEPTNNAVVVKPIDNMEHPSYYLNANDVYVNRRVDQNVLRRMRENLEHVIGANANAVRPPSFRDTEFLQAIGAMANNSGGRVITIDEIVNANSQELSGALINVASADLPGVNVTQSILQSLRNWIKLNPDGSDVAVMALDGAIFKTFPNYDTENFMPFHYLMNAVYDSAFHADVNYLAEKSILMSGVDSDVLHVDSLYSSSSPSQPDLRALLYSHARQLNSLLFTKDKLTEKIINKHIVRLAKRIGLTDETEIANFSEKVKKVAGLLRSVHPIMHYAIMDGTLPDWFVQAIAGLPADMQVEILSLKRTPQGKFEAGKTGNATIDGFTTKEGFDKAITHIKELISSETVAGLDESNLPIRKLLYDNNLGFLYKYASNPTAVAERIAVKGRMRSNAGIVEARQFKHEAEQTVVRSYQKRASVTLIDLYDKIESGVSVPIRDLIVSGIVATDSEILLNAPEDKSTAIMKISAETKTHIDSMNNTSEILQGMSTVESIGGMSQVASFEDFGAQVRNAKAISRTDTDAQEALTLARQLDPRLLGQLAMLYAPMKNILDTARIILKLKDLDAVDDLILALLNSNNESESLQWLFKNKEQYNNFIDAATDIKTKKTAEFSDDVNIRQARNIGATDTVGTFNTSRMKALAALAQLTEVNDISTGLVQRMSAYENAAQIQVDAWNWANGVHAPLLSVMGKNLTALSKRSDELSNMLSNAQRTAVSTVDNIRVASMSTEFGKSYAEFRQAVSDGANIASKFLGHEFDPNIIPVSLSQAYAKGTPFDGMGPLETWDLIKIKAAEMARHLQHIKRTGQEYDPNDEMSALAEKLMISGVTEGVYVDSSIPVPMMVAYNRGGLERVFQLHLLAEAQREHGDLATIVTSRVANDETTELYHRNVQAVRSAAALRGTYLAQTKNGAIAIAIHPENIGETSVDLHVDVKNKATTGQLLFNQIYDSIKKYGTKNLTRLEANVKNLLEKAPKERDVSIVKYADIVKLAKMHGVELDVVMSPSIDGKGFSAPAEATSKKALPHRIVSLFSGLISHDLMNESINVPDALIKSFPKVNWSKETGLIISGIDIFSILPHLKNESLQNNMSLGTFTQLKELYSALLKNNKDDYNPEQLQKLIEIQKLLKEQSSVIEDNGSLNQNKDFKTIVNDKENAIATAKSISSLIDRFAVGAAFRALDYDMHSNANRNKYFALALAAGMPETLLQQMFANNISVKQMLSADLIGDYEGPRLTKEQTMELQSLRLAQLHQDQYRDNKSVGFLSDLAKTHATDYAAKSPNGFFKAINKSNLGSIIWLKNLGFRKSEDVAVHEIGHYIFHTLPDYLQVKWMQALNPQLDSREGISTQVQPGIRQAYDQVTEAVKLLNEWEAIQKTQPKAEQEHSTEFKLPNNWAWNTMNQEMTTVGLTNFMLAGGIVQSKNSGTLDGHAMSILQHLSIRLREALKLTNSGKSIDEAVITDANGNPLDAFWYSLQPVQIDSGRGASGNRRTFYPLKHNSYVQFVAPANSAFSDSGVITNPMASILKFRNSGGVYDGAFSFISDIDAQNEIKRIFDSNTDVAAIEKKDLIFQFSAGPYKIQDADSFDPLTRGYVTNGKVVGMAFASKFTDVNNLPSKFKALGWKPDSTGKNRLWVSINREDDNGWYQSSMPYMLNGQNSTQNLYTSDYSYIIETIGTAQLLEADGVSDSGRPKYKVANRRVNPDAQGPLLQSTYKNIAFRYMVPHDAIKDSRVHGLGTSDVTNSTFSEVIYSAISRVSQAIINANKQTDYQHHIDLVDVLAKKYSGDNTGIEQYYQSLDDVTAGLNGDYGKRLFAITPEDSAAINAAQISGWPRTVINSRQLNGRIRDLYPDEIPRNLILDDLEQFLLKSRLSLLDPTDSDRLLKPYIGIPHKLVIGGDPTTAENEAIMRGSLVLKWMNEHDNISDAFGKLYTAYTNAKENNTSIDWESTGLDFNVTVESKKINIEGLFDRVFDPDQTPDEIKQTITALQNGLNGKYEGLPTRVTLDHVNKSAINHILTKVITDPVQQKRFLDLLFQNDVSGSTQMDSDSITAKNIFNSIRHVMATDSQTRRTALRNWRKWNIHEIDGNSVILRAPSRDIAIRGSSDKKGALMRVDLSNGKIDYVYKTKVFRNDGVREQYVSVTTADNAYKSLVTGLKRKIESFSAFRNKQNANALSLRDLFPGQDETTMLAALVGADTMQRLNSEKNSSAVFFMPSTDLQKSFEKNDGLVGFKVTKDKDGKFVVKRVSEWWNSNDDFDTQNISSILGIAFQNQPSELRASVAGRQLYGEAYHIARLLLLKDQMQLRPEFVAPDRINDTPLIVNDPKLKLNDVGNLGTGRTWYSIAEPHESEYFEGFNPDGQIDIFPPSNIKKDHDAYVEWATAAAINRGENYVTSRSQDIAYVVDPSLTDTIGLGRDGYTQIVYLPENMYDAATGLPKENYYLKSDSGPPENVVESEISSSNLVDTSKIKDGSDKDASLVPSGPNLPTRTNATGAAKFAVQALSAIKNDAQFILGMDLSTFGIQMIGRGMNDPVGFITSILGVSGMLMPNREDIPFFLGLAIDRAARLKGNKFGNLGDWHYSWTMDQVLKRYNQFHNTSYQIFDLEKYGWNSSYSSWRHQHAINTARDPTRYKMLTDTPFDVPDETLSRGILRELAPSAKRFDQTRLLCRDIFALKAGLDIMRNVNNQVEKKPYEIGNDLHTEMRNLNLDLGLQQFGDLPGQAAIFKGINMISNATQNAPSYHRQFVNANPLLRTMSMFGRDTIVNKSYRKATKKLNGGWFDGDIYDVSWERKFIEMGSKYGQQKQFERSIARIFGGLGLITLATVLGYLKHKGDPAVSANSFTDNDYLNLDKKQIGYTKVSKDTVFEVLPVSKPLRYLRPFLSLMSPNAPTLKSKAEAFTRSAVKTYIQSRQGNIASGLTELITGQEFSGGSSFETNAGAAILKASNVRHPYEYAPSNVLLPTQSKFITNHFNLISAAAYYKDAEMLALEKNNIRKNVVLHGLFGDVQVDEIPILTQADVDKLNRMDVLRRAGFSGFIEPENVKRANLEVQTDGDLRATWQRWSYLLKNDFFDWASAAETTRKRGFGPILQGYGVDTLQSQMWGVPNATAIKDATPIKYPNLPIGKAKAEAYVQFQDANKPSPTRLMIEDFKRQFNIDQDKDKNEQ